MRRLFLLFLVPLTSCDLVTGGSELDRLRENRGRWELLQLSDYDFHFQRSCYCGQDYVEAVRVEVRGDRITRVVSLRTGIESQYSGWPTIDSLFAWTEQSFGNGYNLEISYDARHRFPRRVSGDIPRTADDEFVYTSTSFVRR